MLQCGEKRRFLPSRRRLCASLNVLSIRFAYNPVLYWYDTVLYVDADADIGGRSIIMGIVITTTGISGLCMYKESLKRGYIT